MLAAICECSSIIPGVRYLPVPSITFAAACRKIFSYLRYLSIFNQHICVFQYCLLFHLSIRLHFLSRSLPALAFLPSHNHQKDKLLFRVSEFLFSLLYLLLEHAAFINVAVHEKNFLKYLLHFPAT